MEETKAVPFANKSCGLPAGLVQDSGQVGRVLTLWSPALDPREPMGRTLLPLPRSPLENADEGPSNNTAPQPLEDMEVDLN